MQPPEHSETSSGCCGEASWKREEIAGHKFDYVDVDEFLDYSPLNRLRYSVIFAMTLKSILVYMADIGILIIMITAFNDLARILNGETKDCDEQRFGRAICSAESFSLDSNSLSTLIPIPARLGIVFASMFFSFLLLAIEWRKGRRIVRSRDISYALTSTVAYRYYCIQSFAHFCFFRKIRNSRRTLDILAFYVFFTFKNWKRLLLAEFPRQLIYALFVYDVVKAQMNDLNPEDFDSEVIKFFAAIYTYFSVQRTENPEVLAQYSLMAFTVTIWLISFTNLIVASLVYLPLLSKIRGNLKEYCCHKIDKRIDEILRKKSRKRQEKARNAELENIEKNGGLAGGKFVPWVDDVSSFTHASSFGGRSVPPPFGMIQGPTLPTIPLDSDMYAPVQFPGYGYPTTTPPQYYTHEYHQNQAGSYSSRSQSSSPILHDQILKY